MALLHGVILIGGGMGGEDGSGCGAGSLMAEQLVACLTNAHNNSVSWKMDPEAAFPIEKRNILFLC